MSILEEYDVMVLPVLTQSDNEIQYVCETVDALLEMLFSLHRFTTPCGIGDSVLTEMC